MIALLACSAVTAVVGYVVGVFAARCASADDLLRLEVDRDIANHDAAEAQREATRWRRIAQARPSFSTGAGSPWQPVDLEVERAPS